MSDRELLELAAKAIGDVDVSGMTMMQRTRYSTNVWFPLADDGDALRLATRLNIDIMFFNGFQEVVCCGQGIDDADTHEPYGEDIQAAVRRCIVRAAAEIGRSMP